MDRESASIPIEIQDNDGFYSVCGCNVCPFAGKVEDNDTCNLLDWINQVDFRRLRNNYINDFAPYKRLDKCPLNEGVKFKIKEIVEK